MKSTTRWHERPGISFLAVLLAGFVVVACPPAEEEVAEDPNAVEPSRGDEDALNALVADFMVALNTGDADAMAALYASDAVRMQPEGPPIAGRETIRQNISQFFETGSLDVQLHVDETVFSGELAYVMGTFALGVIPNDGSAEDGHARTLDAADAARAGRQFGSSRTNSGTSRRNGRPEVGSAGVRRARDGEERYDPSPLLMSEPSPQSLTFMGAPGSPYTRKMRAVLRYRRIPYRFLISGADGREDLPAAKVRLLPTFYLPNAGGESRGGRRFDAADPALRTGVRGTVGDSA